MNSEAQWAIWGNAASRGGMFAILKGNRMKNSEKETGRIANLLS